MDLRFAICELRLISEDRESIENRESKIENVDLVPFQWKLFQSENGLAILHQIEPVAR